MALLLLLVSWTTGQSRGASQRDQRTVQGTVNLNPAVPADADALLFQEKISLASHLAKKYRKPDAEVYGIVEAAYTEALKHGLSPLLVLAIIEKESSLRVSAASSYGAMGLMQVVPRFHPEKLSDPHDSSELLTTEGNIRIGTLIVAEYLKSKGGNLKTALVKYSGNAREYYPRVMRFKESLKRVQVAANPSAEAVVVAAGG